MATVGQILKEAREKEFYSLEEVEKATKIRKELLIALESDHYEKLPPPTFVRGFIKNYAKYLNLDSEKILAIYRREFSEKKHQPYIMDAFAHPVEKKKFQLTPTRVLGGLVSIIILTFFVYLWFQYRGFVGPPQLVISSPADQLTTDNASIKVEGKTDPEMKVLINSQEISLGLDGSFKEEITLSSPVNKIDVIAISKLGQKTQIERTVYLKR